MTDSEAEFIAAAFRKTVDEALDSWRKDLDRDLGNVLGELRVRIADDVRAMVGPMAVAIDMRFSKDNDTAAEVRRITEALEGRELASPLAQLTEGVGSATVTIRVDGPDREDLYR